jgi:hypothetical protein
MLFGSQQLCALNMELEMRSAKGRSFAKRAALALIKSNGFWAWLTAICKMLM